MIHMTDIQRSDFYHISNLNKWIYSIVSIYLYHDFYQEHH